MVDDRELLERAAAKLNELLADVTTGRWQVDGPWMHPSDEETGLISAGLMRISVVIAPPPLGTGRDSGRDLEYIARLGPDTGRALVRWLQDAAYDVTTGVGASPLAVAVARAILADDQGGGR